jgi:hypothetical protein
VTAPSEDYDRDITVGFSGWLLGPEISGAAHTATVDPNQTSQLPEGGTSFRSEVPPPLLMAIGGTRVLTPTDIRTRIVLTSWPFRARAPGAWLDVRED